MILGATPSSVSVTSNVPSQATGLLVTIIPPKLPSDGNTYPAVVVSLVDSNNLPSAALANITVYLTSSRTDIVSVPPTITIPAGSEYVVAGAATTTTPGSAIITASSLGLTTAYATLTTATPSGIPSQLEVFVTPSGFLDQADSGQVRVEVVDGAGNPSKAITPVNVTLSSSDNSVASLDQANLTIEPGEIYSTGTFQTYKSPGQAWVTATSKGYKSGYAVVTVNSPTSCGQSCSASELLLKPIPGTLPTGGLTYGALEVGLATSAGLPAVALSNTTVTLSSDAPDVVSVLDPIVFIPADTISIVVNLTTSALEGQATITATSTNLKSGNATIATQIPAPSAIKAYVAPPSLFASSSGNSPILVLQLQDSSGNPARARQQTEIEVTSSNASIVSGPLKLGISKGNDVTAPQYLSVSGSGSSVLTASSQDLSSSEVSLQLVKSPLTVHLSASLPYGYLYSNETLGVTLSVDFLGTAVKGANVTWTATGGSVLPSSGSTGQSGQTSTAFTPLSAGTANITAQGTSQVTGSFGASYIFAVIQPPTLPAPTLAAELWKYWYLIVAVVAVVIIVLAYFLHRRRVKQRAEIEAGFEVV
jgi:hypothetical protein